MKSTSRMQDAVRILLLVAAASEPLSKVELSNSPIGSVSILRTQVALQKLDFWLRNPDYLANEVLTTFEETDEQRWLSVAEEILTSEEPEVRRYPMLRFKFGAHEPLDEALAVLASTGLVYRRRVGDNGRTREHDYYLTNRGHSIAEEIVSEVEELRFYPQRINLILELFGGLKGTQLKNIQYEQPEYAETAWGNQIESIAGRARQRLETLKREIAVDGEVT